MLKNIYYWLVRSSANPAKIALTVKGILVTAAPAIIFLTGLAHLNLGASELAQLTELVVRVIEVGLGTIGLAMTAIGLLRKIWITVRDMIQGL